MQDNLQNVIVLESDEALPSTEVTPDKPFNECLHCEYNRNGCSFANLLATGAERTCEILQAQRILLGKTYHDVSVKTGMSEVTVIRILTGKVKNPSFDSMHRLNNALVADPNGKFPCAKQLILASHAKENNDETLASEREKVAYLREQIAKKDKQIEERGELLNERRDFLRLKDAEIAELKKERKGMRVLTAVLSFLLAAALVYTTFTLVVDYRNPHRGFWWMEDGVIGEVQE